MRQSPDVTLMPAPGPEDSAGLVEVVKVLLAALGGGAGFMAAGPFGAAVAAGATQGASAVLDAVADRWRSRQTERALDAVGVAVRETGLSPEKLADVLVSDGQVLLVAATALNAAAETALDEKVQLMGRVDPNAATDTARVDEELLVARAMRVLDTPHVRLLSLLAEPPRYEADADRTSTYRWTPAALAARSGWPQRSVTSVLMTLQSQSTALLSPSRMDGGQTTYRDLMRLREPVKLDEMHCEITDFGAYLVERLEHAKQEG
jgi:hypothetical protein